MTLRDDLPDYGPCVANAVGFLFPSVDHEIRRQRDFIQPEPGAAFIELDQIGGG
jgi:hypothetical protein